MSKYSIDPKEMGKILRSLRGSKSPERVASDLNISVSALHMYESGERIPRDSIKVRICNYYNRAPVNIFFHRNAHET